MHYSRYIELPDKLFIHYQKEHYIKLSLSRKAKNQILKSLNKKWLSSLTSQHRLSTLRIIF